MIWLSGCTPLSMLQNPRPDLGVMLNPAVGGVTNTLGKALPFWRWGADVGYAVAAGGSFEPGDWLEWLAGLRRYRQSCLFAVAPDVLGDADATLRRSLPYLPTIRQLGFPAAFVTQDGCASQSVPWDDLDVLFVGGSNDWKWGEPSFRLCDEGRRRGKWVHVGRVNSLRRLMACKASAIDSADGTFLKFGPDENLPRLHNWLDALQESPQSMFVGDQRVPENISH